MIIDKNSCILLGKKLKGKFYTIGVTGHRDLQQKCISYYERKVYELLQKLQKEYKNLLLYTPLAEGADRLLTKEALKLHIPFEVVLPMPEEIYAIDFDTESKREFYYLMNKAKKVTVVPLCNGCTIESISVYGQDRDMQYEAVGKVISDISDTLIALWDGKNIGLKGGTGEIVNYYLKKDNHKMYHLNVSRSKDITNTMIDFKIYENSS